MKPSMLNQWERLAADLRDLGHVTLGELRTSWKPWAIGCGLAYLALVVVEVVR